jgi:hypothetical protein
MRAKRVVLTLAPESVYPSISADMAALWPGAKPARVHAR